MYKAVPTPIYSHSVLFDATKSLHLISGDEVKPDHV